MSIVTLTGDRQAGKTHAALSAAITAAACGHLCAYVGVTLEYAGYHLGLVEQMVPELIEKVVVAAGEAYIAFGGGGRIIFRSHRQIARMRGLMETCVLDDWDPDVPVPPELRAITDHLYVCLLAREEGPA